MEKLEHLTLMLNKRTKGKKYESFIIISLYARLSNPELIPITQQYVKSNSDKNKYYLLDLYFPQLNYGVEVDEGHHLNDKNSISDVVRSEDILNSIECEQARITIFGKNGVKNTYDEINRQIDIQVNHIKKLINKKEEKDGKKLKWEDNEDRKNIVKNKRIFDIQDDVNYQGVTEIYNMLGNDVSNLGRCFVKLNDSYKLWVPHLAVELNDGTIKTKNDWENTLSEDKTIIKEVFGDSDKKAKENVNKEKWNKDDCKRIVFMHIKDEFGVDRVKFLGVYEKWKYCKSERYYKRIETSVHFNALEKALK